MMKSILKNLKKVKSFSIIVVPDNASKETKSKKITLIQIIGIILVYSVIVSVLGFYVLNFTGIGDSLLPGNFSQSAKETQQMEQLNEKVIFLAKELQALRSANQKLKYAMALGDSSLIDSLEINTDTLKKYYQTPREGSILGVLLHLINKYFTDQPQENKIFFILPANGYISRAFDPERGHFGIDIVVKDGTPVYASAGGFVVFSGYTNNFGHIIILSHSDGYLSIYKHC